MLALWVGSIIGILIYKLFVSMIIISNPLLGLYLSISASATLMGVVSMIFFDISCIFGSAAVGAYCLVRGFAIVFGHYPNELIILESYHNHLLRYMNW